jgi:hypothetical protein
MRILFAISTFALLALLWASISIARHVRRARRRRRELAAKAPPIPYANPSTPADWEFSKTELTDTYSDHSVQ